MRNTARFGSTLGAALLLTTVLTARAEASSLTFTFDCTIFNTNPATCTSPTGPFGQLVLTDSTVDPNRVDVDLTMFSLAVPGATGLDTFYLNYDNSVTVGGSVNRAFGMVAQNALVGDHTSAGNTGVNFNTLGPYQTTLDVSLDPNGAPGFTYHGSLVVYSTLSGHAESNLDVSMFYLKDNNNLLWAAFNTLPSNQNQQYGAKTALFVTQFDGNAVPEPTSLLLLGSGLLLATRLGSRLRSRRQ